MPSVLRKVVFFGRAKLQLNSANKETLYMYVNTKKTESHIIYISYAFENHVSCRYKYEEEKTKILKI